MPGPNAFLGYRRTVTPAVALRRALMYMGTAMSPVTLRALAPQSGSASDIAQAQADLLYDSQMEIIRKLPGLNVVTTDVVVAAGGLGVLLPADLMEQQVQSVRWNEPTFPERHLRRIEITTRRDLEDTSGGWSNPLGEANATAPTWTDEWPRYGYFDREDNGTAAYLRLIPKPSSARTVTVTYRARLVPYTVADMTAVNVYLMVPEEMTELSAVMFASNMARAVHGPESKIAGRLFGVGQRLLAEHQNDMSSIPAQAADQSYESAQDRLFTNFNSGKVEY